MSACLITTGGTSGTLRIDYTLGSDANVIFSTHGDIIYVDSTATSVTYTTLTGDVTATSGCLTVTSRPINYYLITYDRINNDTSTYDPQFTAVMLDNSVNALSPTITAKLSGIVALFAAINTTLANDNIKIVGYKVALATPSTVYYNVGLIIRVIGTQVPSLRLTSPYSNISYLKGVTSTALPAGFTLIDIPIAPAP